MNQFKILKSTSNQFNKKTPILNSIITTFLHKTLIKPLIFTRQFTKKTIIPKKQVRVRDHAFDNYMEIQKKVRKILKFQELILAQPHQSLPISRLGFLTTRIGFKKAESTAFVLRFPVIFEVYEHPVQRILYLRLTREALLQIDQEKKAVDKQINDAVVRLRKLLMLSNTRRLYFEHVRIARREFGFPDDFEYSVVLKHPQYFRLFDGGDDCYSKYIELVENVDENENENVDKKESYRRLDVCAIERAREIEYRKRGSDEENVRFAFVVNFPDQFKIDKYFRIAMWKWQRLPYWSPYEDISGYDMRSSEAKSRWEKRAVAMIHEIVSLTIEKKISLERIAHFRITMDLPKRLKDFLLQHQGIFYISTRGNLGKLHTIFLRDGYWKGELVEPNDVYFARKRLDELIRMSSRKVPVDMDFASYSRRGGSVVRNQEECVHPRVNRRGDAVVEKDLDLEMDSDVGSDCSDGDDADVSVGEENEAVKDGDLTE